MIASAHIAAGAVAGLAAAQFRKQDSGSDPGTWTWRIAAALALGLLSHAVLDAVPHSDYASLSRSTIIWVAMLETVGVTAIAARLARRRLVPQWPVYLMAGIVGGAVPDTKFIAPSVLPPELSDMVVQVTSWGHSHFHATGMPDPAIGLFMEVAVTVSCLAILAAYPRVEERQPAT